MPQWEYARGDVHWQSLEEPTGEQGFFGGKKMQVTQGMCVGEPGAPRELLDDYLRRMGEQGWELVGTIDTYGTLAGGLPNALVTHHWLYFKRPKP